MVRINLLASEREKQPRKASAGFDIGQKVTLLCSLILLATALGIGVRTLGLKLKKWKELKLVEETL